VLLLAPEFSEKIPKALILPKSFKVWIRVEADGEIYGRFLPGLVEVFERFVRVI
jgi:hypothetical protein